MMDRVAAVGGRIDAIAFCPHGPDAGCACRKPAPGLLLHLGKRFGTTLHDVPVIGDSLRDLEAALSVGAKPILVRTGKGRLASAQLPSHLTGITVVDDLDAAVATILASSTSRATLRSLLFQVFFVFAVVGYSVVIILVGRRITRASLLGLAASWSRVSLGALKRLCRLDYRIVGIEKSHRMSLHPDGKASVGLGNHCDPGIIPRPQAWVLKQELMRIPFFRGSPAFVPADCNRSQSGTQGDSAAVR